MLATPDATTLRADPGAETTSPALPAYADLLAESAERTRVAVADQVDRDRTAAIRAAVADGVAVEDETGTGGRFWFVRDHGHPNPAASWHDEDGDACELGDLPYALVVANNQTPPTWQSGGGEAGYFDEDCEARPER